MFRKIAVVAVLMIVLATAFASASNLNVTGGTIQAGVDSTLYCDLNGVEVLGWGLETDVNEVSFVRIGDIDSACIGNDMFVKVFDGSGLLLAHGQITPITTNVHIIPFASPYPEAEQIESIRIWIEGPAGPP